MEKHPPFKLRPPPEKPSPEGVFHLRAWPGGHRIAMAYDYDHAAYIFQAVNSHASLTAALDQCIEALEHISSWRLKAEMSGVGPDHTNQDELLDLAITLARAARDVAKKARGT